MFLRHGAKFKTTQVPCIKLKMMKKTLQIFDTSNHGHIADIIRCITVFKKNHLQGPLDLCILA